MRRENCGTEATMSISPRLLLYVECDRCKQSWSIDSGLLPAPVRAQTLTCQSCKNQFSVSQGILNHFCSENIFAAYIIKSSWIEVGTTNIQTGQIAAVNFATTPAKVFKIFLTPLGSRPVILEPTHTTAKGFNILSSTLPGEPPTSAMVNWTAFGESEGYRAVPWKQALADSKSYELQKDSNMEVVTSELAFELFVDEFLRNKVRLRPNTMARLLRRTIEEKVSIWYAEATGQSLGTQFPSQYAAWQKNTKEVRDRVIHKGYQTNPQQGKDAFKAAIELISRIDEDWFLR